MSISPEKMTFLTANYGLTPEQIEDFADGFHSARWQLGGEIEYEWSMAGIYPPNPEACMIETLCDADRLHDYIDDYMDWCFDFLFKQELAHDLLEVPLPQHCVDYLNQIGKSAWMLQ